MPFPKYHVKTRFYRSRTLHRCDALQYSHYPPHKALCGAEGTILGNRPTGSRRPLTCFVCEQVSKLNDLMLAGFRPPWRRFWYGRVEHILLAHIGPDAQETVTSLCGKVGTTAKPGKDAPHCEACTRLLEQARPNNG